MNTVQFHDAATQFDTDWLTEEQIRSILINVKPKHPVLRRLHEKLNNKHGVRTEAAITSYDRMHHRHNRS